MTQEESAEAAAAEAVCVAVNIRPLVPLETAEGCKPCLHVTPGEPQVGHGAHLFTYDHVFGSGAEPVGALYERCVAPLVDGLFKGYNATVFAYGQTGSGKTYTMGSAFTPGGEACGVIPSVMHSIFVRLANAPPDVDYTVRVGFVEIHKEEIHDLLCTGRGPHPAVHIREAGGSVCLAGAAEKEVHTEQEMVEVLEHGTLLRATAATGMNKQSSRSHAIFTITLEQRRLVSEQRPSSRASGAHGSGEEEEDDEEEEAGEGVDDAADYTIAKMHLVDLAGSERVKRTKAVGARLQEGININRGLLALGNVINALSEGKAHVPYRDSKLTRMLQDSLGGNSRTVMIACVSPADVNLEESLNTLRYANRARNIRNKPVVNRDPVAAQIAQLRQACAALKAENASLKCRMGEGGGAGLLDFGGPGDELLRGAMGDLEARNRKLQAENQRLHVEKVAAQDDVRDATEKMIVAQAQRDRLQQRLHALDPAAAAEAAAEADAIAQGTCSEGDVVKGQLERIAELEREVKRLKQVSRLSGAFAITRRQSMGASNGDDAADLLPLHSSPFRLSPLLRGAGEEGEEACGEDGEAQELSALELHDGEFLAQEQAHNMQVERMRDALLRLQREMEAKQAAMQSMSQHSALRQRYDEKLMDLQQQRDELQHERMDLLHKLESLQHASEDERLRLRVQYETRIKALDAKVKAVAAKEKRTIEVERMKAKAESACQKLQHDILSIKQQKVSLQRQMDKSMREFVEWKRQRDRELLQLKKQGRLNAAQLMKLEALHSKQQAVLRRKTEEAEAARRKLKDMEDRRHRAVSRPATAAPAADRPFTAPLPSAAAAAPSGRPPRGSDSSVERSSTSATSAAVAAESECEPNQQAPLLRDERARREWLEGELDGHCSSFELQQVMEGERVQRSECARMLRKVEKQLAALKAPEWWGSDVSNSPSSGSEEKLVAKRQGLEEKREEHSHRFEQAQAKLMEARAAEDAKGGVPADVRRWNGVRTVVQARALLKTLFRAASQHKAAAMETQAQVADLSDEMELLKLRLDIAEQEKYEAAQQVAQAEVLLNDAEERNSGAIATPAKGCLTVTQLLLAQPGSGEVAADEGLREAHEILQQLNDLAADSEDGAKLAADKGVAAEDADPQDAQEEEEEGEEEEAAAASQSDAEEGSWDEEEEEEEQSEDEERHALWDPSLATPARGSRKARRRSATAAAAAGSDVARQLQAGAQPPPPQQRRRSSTNAGALLPEELPVLTDMNERLVNSGREPVAKPTVPLLKSILKEQMKDDGKAWVAGSKKREDLIREYRVMLGLTPDVPAPNTGEQSHVAAAAATGGAGESSTSSGCSAPKQPQQQVRAQLSSRGGEGNTTARSRILEHTASSLARCAATQQHHHAQTAPVPAVTAVAAAAVAAAVAAPRGFGSPVPPPARSRAVSDSPEHAADGSSSTPVGAEGQPTPEAAELQPPQAGRQQSLSGVEGDRNCGRARNLQLAALRQQLSALQDEGAVTLGMNPDLAPAATEQPTAAAAAAPAAEAVPVASDAASNDGGSRPSSQQSSPRRAWTLWHRGSAPAKDGSAATHSGSAPATGRLPRLQTAPAGSGALEADEQPSSPAAIHQQQSEQCKQEAVPAAAAPQVEAELRPNSGSPGRLARLFGRGGSPSKAAAQPATKQVSSAVAAGDTATYDLPPRQDKAAAQPLRSSNGEGGGGGGAGGSRSTSPGSRDFRISSYSPENRSQSGSPTAAAAAAAAALAGGPAGGGRSRSGSGGATRPASQASPRKQAWKPM